MHAILIQYDEADQDAVHGIIQNVKPLMIRRWSELASTDGTPLVQLLNENALLVDIEFNEKEHTPLKTLVEGNTSQGTSGTWRVHRWQLAYFWFMLGDTTNYNHN